MATSVASQAKGRPALSSAARPLDIGQRVLLAIVGGYFFSLEVAGLLSVLLSLAIARSEAAMLAGMLAFLIYLVVILWVFAEHSLAKLWLVVPGVTAFSYLGSQLLA